MKIADWLYNVKIDDKEEYYGLFGQYGNREKRFS